MRKEANGVSLGYRCPPLLALAWLACCQVLQALALSSITYLQTICKRDGGKTWWCPRKLTVSRLTIEQAITSYLAQHRSAGHEAKTLEWHQTALGQFREYLLVERHLLSIHQITETDLQGWVAFLAHTPTRA